MAAEADFLGTQPLRQSIELTYMGDRLYPRILIKGGRSTGLDVFIHASEDTLMDRVSLFVELHNGLDQDNQVINKGVQIVDLTGNGLVEGRINKRHNQGYGTLAVHLATQVIRKWFGENHDVPVHGTITSPNPKVAEFWRRFGLQATSPEAGKHGEVTGKVSDIQITSKPYKAGNVIPVDIDLSWFRVLKNIGAADMNDESGRSDSRPRMRM